MRDEEGDRRTADSKGSEVAPEDIWGAPDEVERESELPQDSSGIWEERAPPPMEATDSVVPIESTDEPQALTAALSRLELLERAMTRLAEQIAERPAAAPTAGVGPRAVSEILRTVEDAVQTRLDEFTLEFRRGLSGVEKQLSELVTSSMWQTDEEGRPLAARVEDSLTSLRVGLGEVVEALRSAFGDQLSTQQTVVDRVAEIEELIRDLGERRGLRRLAEAEERRREQEAAFVQQMEQAFASLRMELLENAATRPEVQELTSRLGGFAEAVRESLHEAAAQIRQGLESRFEAAADAQVRQQEALTSMREQLSAQTDAFQSAVARVDSLAGIIESLGRRRGFQDLIDNEQQIRREQVELVERLTAAGATVTTKVNSLEGQLESIAAREDELRKMTMSLGEVLREALDRAEVQLRTAAAEEIDTRLTRFDEALERRLAIVARNDAQVERLSAGLLKLQVQVSETFADTMADLRRSLTEDVARQLTEDVDRRLEEARTIIGETVSAGAEANIQDLAKLRTEIREAIGELGSEVGDLRTQVEDGVRSMEQETAAAMSRLGQAIEARLKTLTEAPMKQAPTKAKSAVRRRRPGTSS